VNAFDEKESKDGKVRKNIAFVKESFSLERFFSEKKKILLTSLQGLRRPD